MEPTEHNRRAWDEIHRQRTEALAGERGLPSPVRHALAGLESKRVLHLQCGTGESTAELAELGELGGRLTRAALQVEDALALEPGQRVPHGRRQAAFARERLRALPVDLVPGSPVVLGRFHRSGEQ